MVDSSLGGNPVLACPLCDAESFVLKGVHGQIKGGFVYEAEK